jgi:hypothetical protein
MTSDNRPDSQESIGTQIANQIIDLANSRLERGDSAEDIAAGLRHAAANFSAYTFFGIEKLPKDPNSMVEEFINFFEHYLDVHKPKEETVHGLIKLVDQVKKDF